VTSPFEIDWKGVPTALGAVRRLRDEGFDCRLVRLSQWPQGETERALVRADEFHEHLPPERVPALVRSCDLLLAASWEQEGFGLPVLEAMACGVPAVASDISCFRDWASPAARLVPVRNEAAFASSARDMLSDAQSWRRQRRAGLRLAKDYRQERSAEEAERALLWVASGRWREELSGAGV
jgi:glycosyltransferase involved in cell wall biosynthesis